VGTSKQKPEDLSVLVIVPSFVRFVVAVAEQKWLSETQAIHLLY